MPSEWNEQAFTRILAQIRNSLTNIKLKEINKSIQKRRGGEENGLWKEVWNNLENHKETCDEEEVTGSIE
jgi:hypothetical protein